MKEYLRSRLVKVGLAMLVLGSGPLWAIVLLAAIGVWPDPNPNPIGPGLLFFLTLWPSMICIGIGVFRVRQGK
jgi:hypothetical membrane protein